jgi:hypothetical protein
VGENKSQGLNVKDPLPLTELSGVMDKRFSRECVTVCCSEITILLIQHGTFLVVSP